jgi:hypothetical protein
MAKRGFFVHAWVLTGRDKAVHDFWTQALSGDSKDTKNDSRFHVYRPDTPRNLFVDTIRQNDVDVDDKDHHMEGGGGGMMTSLASSSSSTTGSQSMEIYALQMQLYSRQKDNKKLRDVFHKAMSVRGGIPHPRTLALIQELGGKMHMQAREYEAAGKTFFQAFKSYDEAGDPSRLKCLKYLVMASMLHASTINPFDSQEARPYRDDPEILAMTNLVQAFHNNDIQTFERILRRNEGRIMDDEFVREHVEDLLRTIRTQVLRSVIRPYTRMSLAAISKELNDIPVADVENLLVGLILDRKLDGKIDQVEGVLLKEKSTNDGGGGGGIGIGVGDANTAAATVGSSPAEQKLQALNNLMDALQGLSTSITSSSSRAKESHMRISIH